MSDLPFDITADILKHLPVKSLLRFRCLSKAHCSLIDSRDFVDLHLSQSKNTNTNRSLIIAQTDFDSFKFREKWNTKSYMMNLDSPDDQPVEFDHPLSHTYYDDFSRYPYICSRVENLAALVGSCLHWIVSGDPQNIVAFNLEDERCRAVPIPDVLKHERYLLVKLGEVGGCLSMCTDDEYEHLVEIWVMKEYGISESWIRIFSTCKPSLRLRDYLRACVKPIGFSKTGDKLLMDVHQARLWECDLRKEEEKEEEEDQTSQQNPYYPDKRVRKIEMGDIKIRSGY